MALSKLSDAKIRSNIKPGRHADGGGLYLAVSAAGKKTWAFLWMRAGKRREMGLGAYPAVSLAAARSKADRCREIVAAGGDPIADRDRAAEPTFGECADHLIASMESSWRNDKHRAQWKMTLSVYCETMRPKRVSEIATADVLDVLNPIWSTKPETASRLRGRIERVLDFAKAKGWRGGENPALWRGHLKSLLPPRGKLTRGHHAAMTYRDVPAFVARLGPLEAMAARSLEFLIVTAARSGEVLGATWPEFDLKEAVWTVPATRMKAGVEHRVPLVARALAIVKELHEARMGPLVFPGQKKGKPLTNMAMPKLMERQKVDQFTVHGFRSAFRDWAGDETTFPREIAEAALAHEVGNKVEQAYRRSDALAKRRKLMEAWAEFCTGHSCRAS